MISSEFQAFAETFFTDILNIIRTKGRTTRGIRVTSWRTSRQQPTG